MTAIITASETRGAFPQYPLPYEVAAGSELRCIGTTARPLLSRRRHLPSANVGRRFTFADGTSARVYRETVIEDAPLIDPCVLVVGFRLRLLASERAHALFRAESILNVPLFVGFPGFVSKLWLEADERGTYRGIYQWDGLERAEHYARSLWRVLAIGSVSGTIRYQILPGMQREAFTDAPAPVVPTEPDAAAWWRVVNTA